MPSSKFANGMIRLTFEFLLLDTNFIKYRWQCEFRKEIYRNIIDRKEENISKYYS